MVYVQKNEEELITKDARIPGLLQKSDGKSAPIDVCECESV